MNQFKYQALKRQFAFLDKSVFTTKIGGTRELLDCENILVRRVNKELLYFKPGEYSHIGSLVNIHQWQRVDFVLRDGSVLVDAVQTSSVTRSNYAYEGDSYRDGESILEAIARQNLAMDIRYIVVIQGGYEVEEHHSKPNFSATIFKTSRDCDIFDVITAELLRWRLLVAEEIIEQTLL